MVAERIRDTWSPGEGRRRLAIVVLQKVDGEDKGVVTVAGLIICDGLDFGFGLREEDRKDAGGSVEIILIVGLVVCPGLLGVKGDGDEGSLEGGKGIRKIVSHVMGNVHGLGEGERLGGIGGRDGIIRP